MTRRCLAIALCGFVALLWEPGAVRAEGAEQAAVVPGAVASPALAAPASASLPCGEKVCSPCGVQYWGRVDYLMWWTSPAELPPLVTTSPLGTPVGSAGVLGQPGTEILFGDEPAGDGMRSGIRTRLGAWLAGDRFGIEVDYFNLGQETAGFDSGAITDARILGRPLFDIFPRNALGQPLNIPGRPAAELVAFPGTVSGRITAEYRDYFDSVGVGGRINLISWQPCYAPAAAGCGTGCETGCESDAASACAPCANILRRADLIAGYRYYRLSDSVTIREDLLAGPQSAAPGTTFQIEDTFDARNTFHGGEIGLATQFVRGPWSLEVLTKVALGNTHKRVILDGSTIETPPGQDPQVFPNQGILVGRTNAGTYTRDDFTAIPQLGLDLGYAWNPRLRTFVGYNILYWASVSRAADQIDLNVDTANFPPPTNPALPFPTFPGASSNFWAQGINLGLQLDF